MFFVLCLLAFKRCSVLNIRNGTIQRKLMIVDLVFYKSALKNMGKNYILYHKEYRHVSSYLGPGAIFYHVIIECIDCRSKITLVKFRSENEAIELKKLIENYGKE